jgi:hypothetical protein
MFCIFSVLDVMILFHVLLNDTFIYKTRMIDELKMIQKEKQVLKLAWRGQGKA